MGHHNRHFAGDPHALHGTWSPPTSTAKYATCRTSHHALEANDTSFCEEDYAVSRYLAEFINSLTNLAYGMWVHCLDS
jgi:dihydroceramidase